MDASDEGARRRRERRSRLAALSRVAYRLNEDVISAAVTLYSATRSVRDRISNQRIVSSTRFCKQPTGPGELPPALRTLDEAVRGSKSDWATIELMRDPGNDFRAVVRVYSD